MARLSLVGSMADAEDKRYGPPRSLVRIIDRDDPLVVGVNDSLTVEAC
jgi:hypothetical protein